MSAAKSWLDRRGLSVFGTMYAAGCVLMLFFVFRYQYDAKKALGEGTRNCRCICEGRP